MTRTFTRNDLLMFLYRETSQEETQHIKKALLFDDRLSSDYQEIEQMASLLDEVFSEPSEKSIENVLNYSKSLDLPSVSN